MDRVRRLLGVLVLAAAAGTCLGWQSSFANEISIQPVTLKWDPPESKLAANYVRLTQQLVGNGLADPRSGRFCHLKVRLNGPPTVGWGWVLPGNKSAVMIDGLEYPVEKVLESANLEITVDEMVRRQDGSPLPEWNKDPNAALPALLLLVGRPDLAERAGRAALDRFAEYPDVQMGAWLYERYEARVADTFSAGRYAEGLPVARQMIKLCRIEEQAIATPRFANLSPTPIRLAYAIAVFRDITRRLANPFRKPLDLEKVRRLPANSRIAMYIDALDTIKGFESSDFGGKLVDGPDPLIQAIRHEGQKMMPALIDAYESDNRLTRAAGIWRADFPVGQLVSVRQAARELIGAIWPPFDDSTRQDLGTTPAEVRETWMHLEPLSEPERWIEALSDDKNDKSTWLQACLHLAGPFQETAETMRSTRILDADAVASLMARRCLETTRSHAGTSNNVYACYDALQMGHCLAKWAPSRSVATLRELCHRVIESGNLDRASQFIGPFADIVMDRIAQGDRSAISDYAQVFGEIKPSSILWPNAFGPICSLPNDPQIQAVARQYLKIQTEHIASSDPQIALSAVQCAAMLTSSPVLTLPGFRQMLTKGLQNTTPAGVAWSVEYSGHPYIRYTFVGNWEGTVSFSNLAPRQPFGVKVQVSVADFLAQEVVAIKDAPGFCMLWPAAIRNRAMETLQRWLSDGNRDWQRIVRPRTLPDSPDE